MEQCASLRRALLSYPTDLSLLGQYETHFNTTIRFSNRMSVYAEMKAWVSETESPLSTLQNYAIGLLFESFLRDPSPLRKIFALTPPEFAPGVLARFAYAGDATTSTGSVENVTVAVEAYPAGMYRLESMNKQRKLAPPVTTRILRFTDVREQTSLRQLGLAQFVIHVPNAWTPFSKHWTLTGLSPFSDADKPRVGSAFNSMYLMCLAHAMPDITERISFLRSSLDIAPDIALYLAYCILFLPGAPGKEEVEKVEELVMAVLQRDETVAEAWYALAFVHRILHRPLLASFCMLLVYPSHIPTTSSSSPPKIPNDTARETALGRRAVDLAVHMGCTEEVFNVVRAVHEQLGVILSQLVQPRLVVHLTGSAATLGLWECGHTSADLDFVLTQTKTPITAIPKLLKFVEAALKHGCIGMLAYGKIDAVPRARVPIVKYIPNGIKQMIPAIPFSEKYASQVRGIHSSTTHAFQANILAEKGKTQARKVRPIVEIYFVKMDISASNFFAIRNTMLLGTYVRQWRPLRYGILLLKKWGRRSGVIDARHGMLSSYSMTILWIYFLLHRTSFLTFLPPESIAKEGHPPAPIQWLPVEGDDVLTDTFFHELGAALLSFFYFYAFEFDWLVNVVTITEAPNVLVRKVTLDWHEVASLGLAHQFETVMCIQDPYELELNLGKGIRREMAGKIASEFASAYQH